MMMFVTTHFIDFLWNFFELRRCKHINNSQIVEKLNTKLSTRVTALSIVKFSAHENWKLDSNLFSSVEFHFTIPKRLIKSSHRIIWNFEFFTEKLFALIPLIKKLSSNLNDKLASFFYNDTFNIKFHVIQWLHFNAFFNSITALYQICFASIVVSDHSRHGVVQIPSFVQEPPAHVTFSNNTGAQITCVTHGNPVPLITWMTKDGSVVNSVPGLRLVT